MLPKRTVTIVTTFLALTLFLALWTGVANAAPGSTVSGYVYGSNEGSVVLSGATVTVRLNVTDPAFDRNNPSRNVVGKATADRLGHYVVYVGWFRGVGLPVSSIIEVSAVKPGYLNILQYGVLNSRNLIVSFVRYGPTRDLRLPYDVGQFPPFPVKW
jgi:hypothetical protein